MSTIFLLSHARGSKPETIVVGEADGLRQRSEGEKVHHREEPGQRCSSCGTRFGIWFESHDRWSNHKEHC